MTLSSSSSGILIDYALEPRSTVSGSKARVQNIEAVVDKGDGNAAAIQAAFKRRYPHFLEYAGVEILRTPRHRAFRHSKGEWLMPCRR